MLLVMVKQLALKLRWNEILAKLDMKNYNAPHFQAHKPALYGRKVFLGGLPAGITTAELQANFCRFGSVVVDWPNKALFESMPPRGYAFLVFENSASVSQLIEMCVPNDNKLCIGIHLHDNSKKVIEVKAWDMRNNEAILVRNWQNFSRNSVFIGGLPRIATANELAMLLRDAVGDVAYVAIEIDESTDYPKGAARAVFSTLEAYIKAIAMRELVIQCNGIGRVAEIKPFIFNKMKCENCQFYGAPSFCPEVRCLKYFCDSCWKTVHAAPGMTHHLPMQKGRYFTTKGHHLGLDEKLHKRLHLQQSGSGLGIENEAELLGSDGCCFSGAHQIQRNDSVFGSNEMISPMFSGLTDDSVFEFLKW
uniref:RRM domain-containing protein n=1 Tax=Acrobeloides nanus TaxID=290746 RepID=A0A914CKG9_9BILA